MGYPGQDICHTWGIPLRPQAVDGLWFCCPGPWMASCGCLFPLWTQGSQDSWLSVVAAAVSDLGFRLMDLGDGALQGEPGVQLQLLRKRAVTDPHNGAVLDHLVVEIAIATVLRQLVEQHVHRLTFLELQIVCHSFEYDLAPLIGHELFFYCILLFVIYHGHAKGMQCVIGFISYGVNEGVHPCLII